MQHADAIAAREIPALLAGWMGLPVEAVRVELPHHDGGQALSVDVAGQHFVFAVKGRDDLPSLERACTTLHGSPDLAGAVPVVVVPHAGPTAREWLRARGLSWLDLSGNADIQAPGLRIFVEGKPDRFATAGRPSTVFSPKASRITRLMLVDPDRWWTQGELTAATRLSAGFVSKVVGRMVTDELLVRSDEPSRVRPRAPARLLDAWVQQYRFSEHHLTRYSLAARTGPAALRALGESLSEARIDWAATGLAAAWALTRHADFRMTTLYVRAPLVDPEHHGLHAVDRGENVWLLLPRDEGVFDGGVTAAGVPCVSPAQVYLDLAAHPERSKEAAEKLRADLLNWRST